MLRVTLAIACLAGSAGGCNLLTCTQLESFEVTNYHYKYSGICADADCGEEVDFATADGRCKELGARLCTMSEITHDVAKGVGCAKDTTKVWTGTQCEGGHVSMAGSFVGSREEGMGPECTADSRKFSFVCCSSDDASKACTTETAEECEADCCKDLEVTYNPVPCEADFDCQSCVPMQADENGVLGCNPENGENIHMKKLLTPSEEVMCCSMEPSQTKCHNGFCTTAPCMGEDFFHAGWASPRGDEWSRAMCKACHHNGCDQCESGYFKNDYNSGCVDCKVLKGCRNCQDYGCNQCMNNKQPKQCDNLRGAQRNTCCDSGEKTMCVKSAVTLPPLPPTPKPDVQTPEPTSASPPTPTVGTPEPSTTGCRGLIRNWGNCHLQFSCCEPGLVCVIQNPWYAQCLKAPAATPAPQPTTTTTTTPRTQPPTSPPTKAPAVPIACNSEQVFGCGKCWGTEAEAYLCTCPEGEFLGCDNCFASEGEAGSCVCRDNLFSGCGVCWATRGEAVECVPRGSGLMSCPEGEFLGCGVCWGSEGEAFECSCPAEEFMGCDNCFPSIGEALACECRDGLYPGCGTCWATQGEAFECTPRGGADNKPTNCPAGLFFGCGECWETEGAAFECSCPGEQILACDNCFNSKEEADTCTCRDGLFAGCGSCWHTRGEALEC